MLLYRILLSLALPVVLARLIWRSLTGAEPWAALAQRLGGGEPPELGPGALWLHAASNGELASARPLIDALCAARPGLRLLVTTNTLSAQALARGWGLRGLAARLAPLDSRLVLRRFFARHRPAALIVVENELWPNRLALMQAQGLPVFVLGGRISARSAARWRAFGLGARLMGTLTGLSAQDGASEAAFLAMGLPPERLLARFNLKTAVAPPPPALVLTGPRASVVLAASTHAGEEEIVLEAFALARASRPDLRLILAPRHPRRGAEIAAMIAARGLPFSTRSAGEPADRAVYLADTMGEMANWYASAGMCFIGGTLVAKGGHTPYEPAAFGAALLHGPSVENHAEAFGALAAAGASLCVQDAQGLAEAFTLDAAAQAALAGRAQAVLGAQASAESLAALLRALLAALPV